MSNTTNAYGTSDAHRATASGPNEFRQNPVHGERPGVDVGISDAASPNTPTTDEIVVANFPSTAEAEQVASDLVAAGIAREQVTVLSDPAQQREFMAQYVRQDNDRHTHGHAFSAFFGALGGAFVIGLVAVVLASSFGLMALIAAAIVGGILGAILGGILGKLAMRPVDNRSIEVVEALAAEGTLVAVRQRPGDRSFNLDDASQILTRHNGTTLRLRPHLSLADLHPGDTRSKSVPEPLHRQ